MPRFSRSPVRMAILVGALAALAVTGCTAEPEAKPPVIPSSSEASASQQPSAPQTSAPQPSAPQPSARQESATPTPSPSPSPSQPTSSAEPTPSSEPTTAEPSPPLSTADPVISKIGDRQWARIESTGTWRPGCPVDRQDLRRLDVNYMDFQGNVHRGDLIAHRDSIDDLAAIFTALFDAGFPIETMRSVEKYGGDVRVSLSANNTSAFNCRRPDQINAPVMDSPHANGRAVDINPYQNPWTDPRCDCWVPSADFAADRVGPGTIAKDSLPWQLFTQRGWIWQDIKVPDYMHFDTGFPSRPR